MKLEAFFGKFELFADAPNAVAKMRELVLELAIQGKLIEQDPNDVSAIASLRKCTRAVRELEVSDNDTVPAGWASVPLGCVIASNMGGGTPSKQNPAYWNGSIPWASVKDIQADKYLTATIDSITEEGLKKSSSNLIPANRLIVVTRMGLGKLAINKIPTAINQDLRAIEPNEALDLDFAYLLFKALKMVGKGVTVKGITIDVLHSMPVALPPLAEQKRIVAKVDELMALCDRLEAQQQERDTSHAALARASLARFAEVPTPANLEFLFHQSYTITPADLRKSILTLAVQRLLVPHDAQSVGWPTKKLKELTTKIGSGSTPSGGKESYRESGVPLIRSMNVHFGGFVYDGLAFLNEAQAEKLKNVVVKADDVLLNITGASIGRVTTAPQDMEGARVNQHVCIVRPTDEILPRFLQMFLASPLVQNLIDDIQVGATREALTKAMIEQFEVPVPTLAEQRRIVAKVDQLMALVGQLETQLTASRVTTEKLMEAVVAELTTQDAR